MDDYLEFEKDTKTIKSINLDDFSVEDLKEFIKLFVQVDISSTSLRQTMNIDKLSAVNAEEIMNYYKEKNDK